jgi:tRNA U54 and U55 pseudouridine synthase Pus10
MTRQRNELRDAPNKHQSETENTINRERKMKVKHIKEEMTQDMENLRNTKHSGLCFVCSSRLEKMEDRLSEIKEKLKKCYSNTQEL